MFYYTLLLIFFSSSLWFVSLFLKLFDEYDELDADKPKPFAVLGTELELRERLCSTLTSETCWLPTIVMVKIFSEAFGIHFLILSLILKIIQGIWIYYIKIINNSQNSNSKTSYYVKNSESNHCPSSK